MSANNLHSDFRAFLTVDEEKQEQQQHLHPPVKSTPAQMPLNTRTLLCSCWRTNQTFLSASAVCLWQETTESWYEIKKHQFQCSLLFISLRLRLLWWFSWTLIYVLIVSSLCIFICSTCFSLQVSFFIFILTSSAYLSSQQQSFGLTQVLFMQM